MIEKIKKYRMSISKVFPAKHPNAGQYTYFREAIESALRDYSVVYDDVYKIDERKIITLMPKYHTIRANYFLWKKRVDEVKEGKAIITVFEWTGKPYRNKQKNIFIFTQSSYMDVQKLYFFKNNLYFPRVESKNEILSIMPTKLAHNDGLTLDEFEGWFRKYDLSEPMAIIHFTRFRY